MRNPNVGYFGHAPQSNKPDFAKKAKEIIAESSKESNAGLQGILWEEESWKIPFISQVQISRELKFSDRHISVHTLKQIPVSIYNSGKNKNPSLIDDNGNSIDDDNDDEDFPTCSVCLDKFQDGDELRTLACSHCFHKRCIDIWLLGTFSNDTTVTCTCPQCRQSASPVLPQEDTTLEYVGDIPSESFMRVGMFLSSYNVHGDAYVSETETNVSDEMDEINFESVSDITLSVAFNDMDNIISPISNQTNNINNNNVSNDDLEGNNRIPIIAINNEINSNIQINNNIPFDHTSINTSTDDDTNSENSMLGSFFVVV